MGSRAPALAPRNIRSRIRREKQEKEIHKSEQVVALVYLLRTLLGDHPRPVGSVRVPSAPFPAGLVSRSRIRTIGSAREPPTESSQLARVA